MSLLRSLKLFGGLSYNYFAPTALKMALSHVIVRHSFVSQVSAIPLAELMSIGGLTPA
jgi:hypothetical protein